jgi:hypothetical protein
MNMMMQPFVGYAPQTPIMMGPVPPGMQPLTAPPMMYNQMDPNMSYIMQQSAMQSAQQMSPEKQQQNNASVYTPEYVPNTVVQQNPNSALPFPEFQQLTAMPQQMPVGYNIMGNSIARPSKGRKESIMSRNRRERGKNWIGELTIPKLFNMTESIVFDMACGNMSDDDNNDLLNKNLCESIINFCDLRCHNLGQYVNLMDQYRQEISTTVEGQAYNQIHDPCHSNLKGCLDVYKAVRDYIEQYMNTQNKSYLEALYSYLGSDKPSRRNFVFINRLI